MVYADEQPVSYTHLDVYKRQANTTYIKEIHNMIIIMKQGTTHEHVEELSQHIERWNRCV